MNWFLRVCGEFERLGIGLSIASDVLHQWMLLRRFVKWVLRVWKELEMLGF